jgi:hypothetical protein
VTITAQNIQQYIGTTLYDESGAKIGKIGTIFLDDVTGEPEWLTVSTGFFGTKESFVPVSGASVRDDGLTVQFSKDKIKGAPNVDVDEGHLSTDEEADLYRYYNLEYSNTTTTTDRDRDVTGRSVADRTDVDYEDDDADDDAMTRSEERLNVGKETVPTGKARLRKWVETEQQQVEVPVRKEKVELDTDQDTDTRR